MKDGVELDTSWGDGVILRQWLDGEVIWEFNTMTWPEANRLQADLRRALVAAGVTMLDAT